MGGYSQTEIIQVEPFLRFHYILRPSKTFPFAGIKIPLQPHDIENMTGLDLRTSSGIWININVQGPAQVRLLLKTIVPGSTNPQDPLSFRFFEVELPALGRDTLVPWKIFQIPSWFATSRAIPMEERVGISAKDLQHAAWLEILSGFSPQGLDSVGVEVQRLEILRDKNPWPKALWIVFPFFIAIICLVVYLRRRPRSKVTEKSPLVPDQLTISDPLVEDSNLVHAYLAANYMNPDLDMQTVARDLHLKEYRLSQVFREGIDKPFKTCLGELRLQEAARLLRESPRTSIQEVAFAVGYNHVAHFNRQFRSRFGCAPGNYRQIT